MLFLDHSPLSYLKLSAISKYLLSFVSIRESFIYLYNIYVYKNLNFIAKDQEIAGFKELIDAYGAIESEHFFLVVRPLVNQKY